ncbi:hypothetical protein [Cerasicoccus arenae]|uniref:PEP-CTERM sorting domain-containing protein n=1 Tax=Cerasicoccus arenae TaxID=424488 RepID=A0A8J3DFY5_9BACT|nr:hypothetical protein [Cerasicoccus arenae]MBK1858266.1 hypothetical protein [Cerasicoccus arenae]GHC02275.1 hypothetical protein GCM10007047_18520 [Cerasicoccus arenae]
MKLITILGSAALITANLSAASLITGWDFSNYILSGQSYTIQGGFGVDSNSIVSLYSDITGDGANNSNGTLTYLDGAAGTTVSSQSNNLTSGLSIISRPLGPNFGSSPVGSSANQFAMRVSNPGTLLFVTDTNGESFNFLDAGSLVQYAASTQGAVDATISWDYSFNGVDFFSTGDVHVIDNSLGTGGDLFTIDLDGFGGNYSGDIYLRGVVTGVTAGSELVMDNFQVQGGAIPEPSVYALITGFAVIGLAYVRRRKA